MGVKATLNSFNPVVVVVVLAPSTTTPHTLHFRIQENPPGGPDNKFCNQRISQRTIRTSLEKHLDPRGWGPIASRGGPQQYFKEDL